MSTYTIKGSKELDDRIDADLDRIKSKISPFTNAGILLGGYGRGEGTPFIQSDGTQCPFNDYDLVVIVNRRTPALCRKLKQLGHALSEEVGLTVDLYPYAKRKLPTCEFSLLNYEMRYGHTILWGHPDILNAMPEYDLDQIPPTEGTRLLLNRGKLLLDLHERLKTNQTFSPDEHVYYLNHMLKTLLAMGDSILLMAGKYAIPCKTKLERMGRIGAFPGSAYIVEGYRLAVEMKLWGDFELWKSFNIPDEFQIMKEAYIDYMTWYRARAPEPEGRPLRNIVHNLQWNHALSTAHPRKKLYNAVTALLQDDESILTRDQFYRLWRRFC